MIIVTLRPAPRLMKEPWKECSGFGVWSPAILIRIFHSANKAGSCSGTSDLFQENSRYNGARKAGASCSRFRWGWVGSEGGSNTQAAHSIGVSDQADKLLVLPALFCKIEQIMRPVLLFHADRINYMCQIVFGVGQNERCVTYLISPVRTNRGFLCHR
jgi:hypothetical protein